MKKLDLEQLRTGKSKNIKIGELSQEVIDMLDLNLKPQNINVWSTRIEEHCEKHKIEYSSIDSYYQAVQSIPLIIGEPDYIGLFKNGNLQYVKKLDDISLVGIQIVKGGGNLLGRSISRPSSRFQGLTTASRSSSVPMYETDRKSVV